MTKRRIFTKKINQKNVAIIKMIHNLQHREISPKFFKLFLKCHYLYKVSQQKKISQRQSKKKNTSIFSRLILTRLKNSFRPDKFSKRPALYTKSKETCAICSRQIFMYLLRYIDYFFIHFFFFLLFFRALDGKI